MKPESQAEVLSFALGCDERYFPGLLGTVCSALAFIHKEWSVEFFIFDGGIEAESKEFLEERAATFHSSVRFLWLEADLSPFESLLSLDGNFMSYARLLIPDLIDRSRVVWLDSDLLILRDLAPLYGVSLEGVPVGACLESSIATLGNDISNLNELGIPEQAPYYNAGVLIMDLDALRNIDFTDSALRYLHDNHGYYCWHDQSAINVVLHQKILKLPSTWNTLSTSCVSELGKTGEESSIVFHFLQRPKPWQRYEGDYFSKLLYELFGVLGYVPPELNSNRNKIQVLKWRFSRLSVMYFRVKKMLSTTDKQRQLNSDFINAWECNVKRLNHLRRHQKSYNILVERFKAALDRGV